MQSPAKRAEEEREEEEEEEEALKHWIYFRFGNFTGLNGHNHKVPCDFKQTFIDQSHHSGHFKASKTNGNALKHTHVMYLPYLSVEARVTAETRRGPANSVGSAFIRIRLSHLQLSADPGCLCNPADVEVYFKTLLLFSVPRKFCYVAVRVHCQGRMKTRMLRVSCLTVGD